MVCPNFFLMNVFFALKGSKLFIIIIMIILYKQQLSLTIIKTVNYNQKHEMTHLYM